MTQSPHEYAKFLGAHVTITTSYGDNMEGEIFCYDIERSNSVVLRNFDEKGNVSYKWLKANIVRNVAASVPNPAAMDEKLGPVIFDEVARNAEKAEKQAKKDIVNYGVGVTERAQQVFDGLSRTMPCTWADEDIHVFDVRIKAPYDAGSCSSERGESGALPRVKKVLIGELQKVSKKSKQKESPGPKKYVPPGARD